MTPRGPRPWPPHLRPRHDAPGPRPAARAHLRAQHDGALPLQDSLLSLSVARDPKPVHLQASLRHERISEQIRPTRTLRPHGRAHARGARSGSRRGPRRGMCVLRGSAAPATPLSHARGSEAPWAQARDGPGPHAGARAAPAATSTKVPPQTGRGPRAVAVNTGRVRSRSHGRNGEPPATPRGSRTASPAVSLPTARRRCGHRVTGPPCL